MRLASTKCTLCRKLFRRGKLLYNIILSMAVFHVLAVIKKNTKDAEFTPITMAKCSVTLNHCSCTQILMRGNRISPHRLLCFHPGCFFLTDCLSALCSNLKSVWLSCRRVLFFHYTVLLMSMVKNIIIF